MKKNIGLLSAAILFAILVIFANLGNDGMTAAQEGRTAIIVRNMFLTGNFLEMNVKNGIPYEKPIGHYWMCLPTAKCFGIDREPMEHAIEWGMRLPSALAMLAAVLAAGWMAARMYGVKTAAAAIVILSSMLTFTHLGRLAHIDMPFASAFTCAMACFYAGYLENWKANWKLYGFYAFLAWAVLLKGPLALILAGLVVAGLMLRYRRWKMIWEMRPVTGGVLFLALALPWYVVETIRTNGEFFQEFIVRQNIQRFTGIHSTYRNGERMPIWYYIPKLFAGTLPWSVFAVAGVAFHLKRFGLKTAFRPGTVFLLIWSLTGFVFFSLSALKRGDYLIPFYAALAVLTARAIVRMCETLPALTPKWKAGWFGLAVLLAGFLAVNGSGILIRLGDFLTNSPVRYISRNDARNLVLFSRMANSHFVLTLIAACVLLALLWIFGKLLEKRKMESAFVLVCAGVLAGTLLYYCVVMPRADLCRTVKPFVRLANRIVPKDAEVAYIGSFNTELIFFMNRAYGTSVTEKTRYVISDDGSAVGMLKSGTWKELLRTAPDHRYPAVLLERKTP